MEFSARQLALLLNGEVEGDENVKVSTYSKIEEGKPGTISFLSNPKYEQYIYTTDASIVLVNRDFMPKAPIKATLVRVKDAYMALATMLKIVEENLKNVKKGIDKTARISKSARIGKDCYIGPFVYIGDNVIIGDKTQIYSHCAINDNAIIGSNNILYNSVVVYHHCQIGNNCIIHSTTVIGADGFGFARDENGAYMKMPQNGIVIIGDNVEIGASTTIDRGSMGATIISNGVKLDNQIQIAHNVEVGENTAMAACTGVAGSAKIGKNCIFAGKVGIVGHLSIADNTTVAASSNVTKTIRKEGMILHGEVAIPAEQSRRCIAAYRNLPEMFKTLNAMEKQVAELQAKIDQLTAK
ncbi:MAG: UDP-3-O-(3-hydroxymyristoyl)glucosamine N-acyltransferase [Paludibacteraceae bacterium]|nr:UDP-3-O-(3-hydroxymyristoyl)glucosamine N-acyltransferase [Paludibacteraceae bacterium]MBR4483229.1 UDP-3-O-(3-hydroxymyristoyl)glucosamine N-acyltransferase [Paludibacteraceae bacterium]